MIELTNAIETRRSFKKKTIIFSLKLLAILLVGLVFAELFQQVIQYSSLKYQEYKAKLVEGLTKTEIIREYIKPNERPLPELILQVAKEHHVPAIALQAVVEKESSNGRALYRFEPAVFSRRATKDNGSEDERRMLASSHGVAHVMGYNARTRCGITWDKLYDSYTGLSCGAKILRQNLDDHKEIKDPAGRLRIAFRDYNGSGDAADGYATDAMARVGALLIQQLNQEF